MRAKGALAALLAALLVASWACCARELQGELESSQLLGGGGAADGSGRSLAESAPAPPSGPSAGGALPTGVGATFGQSGLWATFVLLILWAVPISLIFCCVMCR